MQDRATSKQETVLTAIPVACIDSLERISAGMGCLLLLLEIQSERSEACHSAYCLLAMLKAELDQATEKLCPEDWLESLPLPAHDEA
ncbi:DUF1484 family protein [Cupriavidus lacunae]|uniref:DUF1484 domain-containing protein n=1 Tax=Cupriavidus lacunae TaxID=2666307 RepID=A0A370P0B3_9BURK|nr:DUF1484 family protein [Cupriavidus lacunae]RDK11319.1 hypothetical protein DN412_05705 [Cupriavidus lacunae]